MDIEHGSEESRLTALRASMNSLTVKSLFNPRDRIIINQQLRNLSKIASDMERRTNGEKSDAPPKRNISD
jgi:hypothetical protein